MFTHKKKIPFKKKPEAIIYAQRTCKVKKIYIPPHPFKKKKKHYETKNLLLKMPLSLFCVGYHWAWGLPSKRFVSPVRLHRRELNFLVRVVITSR